MDSNLLKEAIADAKAVRQTALANAKAALEEAFTGQLEAMLHGKLEEETAELEAEHDHAEDPAIEDHEIAEILAELEAGVNEEEVPPAPAADVPAPVDAAAPAIPAPAPAPAPALPAAPAPAPAAPAAPAPAPTAVDPNAPQNDLEETVDLDELLQSLQQECGMDEEASCDEDGEDLNLAEGAPVKSSGIGKSDNAKPSSDAAATSHIESAAKDKVCADGCTAGPLDATEAKRPNTLKEENESLKGQLREAEEALTYLRGQLNEINLLNAKLLYTNRLFKEHSMDNNKKMKIVEMFDLAKNVREVKMTYAVVAESLNFSVEPKKKVSSKVQSITEGMASKPVAGTAPKQIIAEGAVSEMKSKFQKLAGIKVSKQ